VKILTTVKRVTDPDAKIKIKPDQTGIITDGVEYRMNSFDEYGVEAAIALKEAHGGEVIVVSVGPNAATKEIRTALAMGADRGILVEADGELDSDAVARVLGRLSEDVRHALHRQENWIRALQLLHFVCQGRDEPHILYRFEW